MAKRRLAQLRLDALDRAKTDQSLSNYPAIYEGFMAKGIPEAEIKPRENVFTFQAWKALGRSVKRGEHGVKVVTFVETEGKMIQQQESKPKAIGSLAQLRCSTYPRLSRQRTTELHADKHGLVGMGDTLRLILVPETLAKMRWTDGTKSMVIGHEDRRRNRLPEGSRLSGHQAQAEGKGQSRPNIRSLL